MRRREPSDQQQLDFSATERVVKHVAIVPCDVPLEGRLESFSGKPFTFAARQRTWQRKRTYLAVFISQSDRGPDIRWLGAAEVARRASDLDRNLEVFRVRELGPSLPLNGIVQWLGNQGGTISNTNGPLSDTMGPRLVTALLALRPDLATTINELTTPRGQPLSGDEGARLALEKDATGVILDSALDDARDMLLDWEPVQPGEPFLRGVRDSRTAHEQHLIGYDAGQFEDWLPVETGEADWKTFAKGGQVVRILNANNGPVETDLGIDLVYFNMSLRSFVLVQYKKMKPDAEGKLWYRGDRRLESQLARMLKVDTRCGGAGGDFRLYPMPCFLKLCAPYALVPDSEKLIPGLYLAREHFEQLWNDPKLTERSRGRRLGWTNVERHLTNTQFTGLVKGGWIGSRGTATGELIRSIIGDSLGSGRPVVAGIKLPRTSDDQDATRS